MSRYSRPTFSPTRCRRPRSGDRPRPRPGHRRLPAVPRLRGHARAAAVSRARARPPEVRADGRARHRSDPRLLERVVRLARRHRPLCRGPRAVGEIAQGFGIEVGFEARVRGIGGGRREAGSPLRGPRLPPHRTAPIEAGDALDARRDQPCHQHRARGLAHSHQIMHGRSVVAIGRRVGDAAAAMERARALHIPGFSQPVGPGELDIPAIRGVGGAPIYVTDTHSDLARVWDIEFEPHGAPPEGSLARIDHVAQSMTPAEMLSWRLFYLSLSISRRRRRSTSSTPRALSRACPAGRGADAAGLPQCVPFSANAKRALPRRVLRRRHPARRLRHRRPRGAARPRPGSG